MANNFQSRETGNGLLKNFYEGKESKITKAVRKRRKKLYDTLIDSKEEYKQPNGKDRSY